MRAIVAFVVSCAIGLAADQSAPRPQAPAAEGLVAAAVARAKAENRTVFVDFSASWCGPCHRLTAFLNAPDVKPIIDAHYVLLTLTVQEEPAKAHLNNPGGDALMAKWGGTGGIPFYAFLNDAGERIANANAMPDGSLIGYPGSPDSIRAFTGLVEKTAPRMSVADLSVLRNHLLDVGPGFASVKGRVTDETGKPVSGASVGLIDRAFADGRWTLVWGEQAKTDGDGRYAFPSVLPAQTRLLVQAAGFMPTPYSAATGRGATQLAIARRQELTGVDVRLTRSEGRRVAGSVLRPDGSPADSGTVTLTSLDWPSLESAAPIARDGTFTIARVPAGRHALSARTGSPVTSGFAALDVADVDLLGVRVKTAGGARLRGGIRIEGKDDPALLTAVRVSAIAVDPPAGVPAGRARVPVDSGGRFELSGLFGKRVVRLDGLPSGWILTSVSRGGSEIIDTPLALTGSESFDDLNLTISPTGGRLTGIVRTGAAPAKGAVVIVFAGDAARWTYPSRFLRTSQSDAKGAFTIEGLPAGQYLVAATDALATAWDSPESLEQLRLRAARVAMREGAVATVSVRFEPPRK